MKPRAHALVTAVVVMVIGLFATPVKAHADTYQFLDLGSDLTGFGATSVYGITDSGTVVLVVHVHVGVPQCANSGICTEYETWVNGIMVNESPTAPNLVFDNGSPCTPTTSFATSTVYPGICNNGHEVYEATPVGQPGVFGPQNFDGPDITDTFSNVPPFIDEVDLNSSGDFAYDASLPAHTSGELFEAIDLSTAPEPGSIVLLGTGLLALATLRLGIFERQR